MWRLALISLAASPAMGAPKPAGDRPDCYCTDSQGRRVELGQRICLHVDGRMFTAECQMSLNVPMWRDMGDGCPASSLNLNLKLKLQQTPRPNPAPNPPANG